jgi:hypothetical protein
MEILQRMAMDGIKSMSLEEHHRKDVSQKYFKLILVLRMG